MSERDGERRAAKTALGAALNAVFNVIFIWQFKKAREQARRLNAAGGGVKS
jgi:hypothetical protein